MKTRRLLKLAEHLESGELGHQKFDFSRFNNTTEPKCGTAGCAIGELPVIDRRNWMWNNVGSPVLRVPARGSYSPIGDAAAYFGIPYAAASHLFLPHGQDTEQFGGRKLGDRAKREQVAANIRAFVEKCS